jgi:hypothetical protein
MIPSIRWVVHSIMHLLILVPGLTWNLTYDFPSTDKDTVSLYYSIDGVKHWTYFINLIIFFYMTYMKKSGFPFMVSKVN